MKKKIIAVIAVIVVIILAICTVSTTLHNGSTDKSSSEETPGVTTTDTETSTQQADLKSFQECFSADLPEGWDISCQDSVFMATFTYDGEEAGYLTFYTPWTTDTDGIVSNILGMHASVKGDISETDMGDYLRDKVCVSFELSSAESENGEETPDDQIHYFYYYPELSEDSGNSTMKDTDWVADLYFNADVVDENEMDEIAACIKMTCKDE